MRLAQLGIPKLWGEDPERLWPVLRWFVTAAVSGILAPGSRGYGLERIPPSGGYVLAANHLATVDHPLIGMFSPRTIFYMAKAELLAMPLVGEFLMWTGAFPVRRGEADRDALREARRLVREGHVVGVHVEGTRQRLGYPGEVKIGGVMIALQEGVPIVPCGVETFRWSVRNRRACSVVWGEPIATEGLRRDKAGYEKLMETVRVEILRLWRQAGEAVAAGLPPELPDGTKRYWPYLPGLTTDDHVPRPS